MTDKYDPYQISHTVTPVDTDDVPAFVRRGRSVEWERNPGRDIPIDVPHEVQRQQSPSIPHPFRWSTTLPNAQGWWWNRAKRGGLEHRKSGDVALTPSCIFVFEADNRFYMLAPDGKHQRDIRTFPDQEWAGPISEPTD